MYRDNMELLTGKVHNFLLNHGALGDMLTSLPALVQARRAHHTDLKMKVWVATWQQELVKLLLAPYGEFEVLDLATFPEKKVMTQSWDGGPVSMNTALQPLAPTHTRNRVHMVDYAFAFLTDSRPESMLERSYPTAAPLGAREIQSDYVVFPVGATSENKLFRASVMTPILKWVSDRGYLPVLVGTKVSNTFSVAGGHAPEKLKIIDQAELIPAELIARCVDRREKTTLLELRDILGHAKAVVGVDGGTLHLAGTTDTNIIFASGTTLPKHRYIARNGNPSHKIRYVGPRDLACTGCQSNWTLMAGDFRFCAYGDSKCMSLLHPDDFVAGLKDLGL